MASTLISFLTDTSLFPVDFPKEPLGANQSQVKDPSLITLESRMDLAGLQSLISGGLQATRLSFGNFPPRAPHSPAGTIGCPTAVVQFDLSSFSAPQEAAPVQAPQISPSAQIPPAPTPRRRRHIQQRAQQRRSRGPREEEVIGHVLVNNKKFKCVNHDCEELTFGRLADLRRHHLQQHARSRVQYFCNFPGCDRANAEGGGKGRSFGTRKDKRDEHMRNVHGIGQPAAQQHRHSSQEMSFSPEGNF